MALRSLPLSLVLFVAACVMIGVSYKLLIDNGLLNLNAQFVAATVLVCAGTVLFFYALAGFLLRVVQMVRPVYLRGLNMFFLRQLSARVNSAFFSVSVIALTLFLAMTSVCGGIGICNAMNSGVDAGTRYDASVTTTHRAYDFEKDDGSLVPAYPESFAQFVREHDYDMARGLADSAAAVGSPAWDDLVERSAQIDFYASDVTYDDVKDASGISLLDHVGSGLFDADSIASMRFDVVRLSDFNAARELAGLDPVALDEGACMLWGDFATTAPYLRAVAQAQPTLSVFGRDMRVQREICGETLEVTGIAMRGGALVVDDTAVPADEEPYQSVLDVRCKPGQQAAFGSFAHSVASTLDANTQPVTMAQTAVEVRAQSQGLTAVVSYLAIYIGFVLVIACAAILAIQQLTDAADSVRRYDLLAKLGAPRRMIDGALLKQVLVYFAFPLVLGIAHTICAMQVVTDVVRVFGNFDIGMTSAVAVAAFLAVYGAYFVVTYCTARAVIHRS